MLLFSSPETAELLGTELSTGQSSTVWMTTTEPRYRAARKHGGSIGVLPRSKRLAAGALCCKGSVLQILARPTPNFLATQVSTSGLRYSENPMFHNEFQTSYTEAGCTLSRNNCFLHTTDKKNAWFMVKRKKRSPIALTVFLLFQEQKQQNKSLY